MKSIVTLVVALCASTIAAQPVFKPSANPVSDKLRESVATGSKNLVSSAELMPPEKYAFHPTPAQMTFGQLIVHIIQTNVVICSAISGTPSPMSPEELKKLSDTAPKDVLVALVRKSFDYCTEGLSKTTDSQLAEEVSMFGRGTGMSRAAAMITIAADWADHYSTAASYLRLNDILPPTARSAPR